MGWVGDQEPSELPKNSLQFGSAIAGDIPASVAATPPMTTTTANPYLVARPRFTVAPHEIHGRYRCIVKLMRIGGSGASNEDTLTEQQFKSVQALFIQLGWDRIRRELVCGGERECCAAHLDRRDESSRAELPLGLPEADFPCILCERLLDEERLSLRVPAMRSIRWLAIIPFIALLIGPFFVNKAEPIVLGLPFLLAWIVAWILITSLIMAVIYAVDPVNREDEP
jgi:Protein of unknown function (DUF3311)